MRTLLFFVCLAMLWGGGQSLYTWMTNRAPLEISVKDYLAQRPDAAWLKLKDCRVEVLDAVYFSTLGATEASELFIPVRAAGEDSGPIGILFQTRDPELLNMMGGEEDSQDEQLASALAVMAKQMNRDIEGLVQFGIDVKSKEKSKLASNVEGLAPNFVIIKDGEKPSAGQAFAFLGIGVVLGGVMLVGTGRKKSNSLLPPGVPPPVPPQA